MSAIGKGITMDNLGSLSVFVQVAQTLSFTAAGRVLGVSSSAVGKSIARMEERLGVRLFHRSTRSITLTRARARCSWSVRGASWRNWRRPNRS